MIRPPSKRTSIEQKVIKKLKHGSAASIDYANAQSFDAARAMAIIFLQRRACVLEEASATMCKVHPFTKVLT